MRKAIDTERERGECFLLSSAAPRRRGGREREKEKRERKERESGDF